MYLKIILARDALRYAFVSKRLAEVHLDSDAVSNIAAAGTRTGAQPQPRATQPPFLSVVVPTFNEHDNLTELVQRLDVVLAGLDWEVVFVDDDSTDGTPLALRTLSQSDTRVRLLHRIGRRGLASAVVEGILSTSAPFIAVMDADLQHDETRLPEMLERLRAGNFDIAVGTRYMEAGGVDGWDERRQTISRVATKLAHMLLTTELSDPMSGFFMLRREAFDRSVRRLSSIGYKILLDILVSARPPLKITEVPFKFRSRVHGESKLDSAVTWEYLMLLLDKTVGRVVPVRFVMFMAVGGFGVFVHMLTLAALTLALATSFVTGQSVATIVAMTFNFFANNLLTYRDKRLRGLWPLLWGLLSFYAICSIGAVSNVGIAAFMFSQHYSWWLSGIAGILLGAVWNYAASSIFTWRK
jgi:dolichol-phosphate mannosyltransferase